MNKERLVSFVKDKRVAVSASVVGVSFGLAPVLSGRADRILSTAGAVAFAHLALEGYYAIRRRVTKRTSGIKSSEDYKRQKLS